MSKPATTKKVVLNIPIGRTDEMTLEEFIDNYQGVHEELTFWFWCGRAMVMEQLGSKPDGSIPVLCQLPKVQEALYRFAVLITEDNNKRLRAGDVYHFLHLCEEAANVIRAYNRVLMM